MSLFKRSPKGKTENGDHKKFGVAKTVGEVPEAQEESTSDYPSIKVFGPGCTKCKTLKENVMQALSDAGKQADFEYVTDMVRIAEAGILTTPALEVDGKIVATGKVLKPKDITKYL